MGLEKVLQIPVDRRGFLAAGAIAVGIRSSSDPTIRDPNRPIPEREAGNDDHTDTKDKPQQPTFRDWYDEFIEGRPSKTFQNSSFREFDYVETDTVEKMIEAAKAEVERRNLKREGNFEYKKIVDYVGWNVDENVFAEYKRWVHEGIRELYDFAGIAEIPKISPIERLTEQSEAGEYQDTAVHPIRIFVIYDKTERVEGIGIASGQEIRVTAEFPGSRSHVMFDKHIKYGKDKVKVKQKAGPIIVPVHKEPLFAYILAAEEVLHNTVATISKTYIERDTQKKWRESGEMDGKERWRIYSDVANEWKLREEGIVHGIAYCFLRENASRLGLLPEEVEEFRNRKSTGDYRYVPRVIDRIQEEGAQEVMNRFQHNPDSLFVEN